MGYGAWKKHTAVYGRGAKNACFSWIKIKDKIKQSHYLYSNLMIIHSIIFVQKSLVTNKQTWLKNWVPYESIDLALIFSL